MKPQQLAILLNISTPTLRHWAGKEFPEFLSPSGQGQNGARRSFSDLDCRILGWVSTMKNQNLPLADILATLRSAQAGDWRNLPPLSGAQSDEIAVVPREAVEERFRALQERQEGLIRERDDLRSRLDKTEQENVELRQKQDVLNERILILNERLMAMLEKEQKRRK